GEHRSIKADDIVGALTIEALRCRIPQPTANRLHDVGKGRSRLIGENGTKEIRTSSFGKHFGPLDRLHRRGGLCLREAGLPLEYSHDGARRNDREPSALEERTMVRPVPKDDVELPTRLAIRSNDEAVGHTDPRRNSTLKNRAQQLLLVVAVGTPMD